MDDTCEQDLYPLHRTKILHLIRHAQGIHNVEGEKDHRNYLSEDLFDAHLTPLGWQQINNLRKHMKETGILGRVQLVLVSPLTRTMQTAVGIFGVEERDGMSAHRLMVENAMKSMRPAISSFGCPPFMAYELCREHMGLHPCDRRRCITEYREIFPAIDFSLIESDKDELWSPYARERDEEVAARGLKFLNWLWTRKEKEIAVVTHSGFLYHTLNAFAKDCSPSLKQEICTHFSNCELRSFVHVHKGRMNITTMETNYPGQIPRGLDLPSDIAMEKHQEHGI